ncbi:MAG: amino acid transporter [Boseongicola sp.]|nr:MAG: amino acid transporter [Boseongicola sp.]
MFQDALSGFALGLSFIIAIGAQNVFVLRQGMMRAHVLPVVLTCAISDAVLISFGVGGFGWIIQSASWVTPLLTFGGALFLLVYGGISAYRALRPKDNYEDIGKIDPGPRSSAILTCLALTWLNPHVYLDTVVLMGTVSTHYDSRLSFALGAIVASFTFFFSLGYGAQRLAPYFKSRTAWRFLDTMVALIMWAIAAKLLLG